jgi:hypothetical protein
LEVTVESLFAEPDLPFRTPVEEAFVGPKLMRQLRSSAARTDREPQFPAGSIPAEGLALD